MNITDNLKLIQEINNYGSISFLIKNENIDFETLLSWANIDIYDLEDIDESEIFFNEAVMEFLKYIFSLKYFYYDTNIAHFQVKKYGENVNIFSLNVYYSYLGLLLFGTDDYHRTFNEGMTLYDKAIDLNLKSVNDKIFQKIFQTLENFNSYQKTLLIIEDYKFDSLLYNIERFVESIILTQSTNKVSPYYLVIHDCYYNNPEYVFSDNEFEIFERHLSDIEDTEFYKTYTLDFYKEYREKIIRVRNNPDDYDQVENEPIFFNQDEDEEEIIIEEEPHDVVKLFKEIDRFGSVRFLIEHKILNKEDFLNGLFKTYTNIYPNLLVELITYFKLDIYELDYVKKVRHLGSVDQNVMGDHTLYHYLTSLFFNSKVLDNIPGNEYGNSLYNVMRSEHINHIKFTEKEYPILAVLRIYYGFIDKKIILDRDLHFKRLFYRIDSFVQNLKTHDYILAKDVLNISDLTHMDYFDNEYTKDTLVYILQRIVYIKENAPLYYDLVKELYDQILETNYIKIFNDHNFEQWLSSQII